jgi:anthranilate synthase/aminodeoxychorismate synthase-like glutamine amidotransferase
MKKINVLFIDNFDSFTYNLVDEFAKRNCEIIVYRNDISMEKIDSVINDKKINLIVISPGPGTPGEAGNSINIIKKYSGNIPIFGVCLGHQAIIEAFGGVVAGAKEIMHGKASKINHDQKTIFKNLTNPISIARYHSLAGTKIPDCLEVTSKTLDEEVMSIRHKDLFVEAVQFHPESIITTMGGKIIENLIRMCEDA